MSNTTYITSGAPIIGVPDNLTAKGADKKRGKSKSSRKAAQVFHSIGNWFHHAWHDVKKPINAVANRVLFIADDFTGYKGKDSKVQPTQTDSTASNQFLGMDTNTILQYAMIGGGGILIFFLIKDTM